MPQMTVSEKASMVDRLRGRAPVNKQTALIVGRATGWWNQDKSRDPLDFASGRRQVFECPKLLSVVPEEYRPYVGRRVGSVDVIGVAPDSEKRRLGWRTGSLVVRCLCGRFENRAPREIRKPSRKEYVDACTVCRNAWAETVKAEYVETGKWPVGGGPTHRSSQFRVDENAKQE